jgi:hypothetical protein
MTDPWAGWCFVSTVLYRCFGYDCKDKRIAVYIGMTENWQRRRSDHMQEWWWPAVDRVTFDEYTDRDQCGKDEMRSIVVRQPVANSKLHKRHRCHTPKEPAVDVWECPTCGLYFYFDGWQWKRFPGDRRR